VVVVFFDTSGDKSRGPPLSPEGYPPFGSLKASDRDRKVSMPPGTLLFCESMSITRLKIPLKLPFSSASIDVHRT